MLCISLKISLKNGLVTIHIIKFHANHISENRSMFLLEDCFRLRALSIRHTNSKFIHRIASYGLFVHDYEDVKFTSIKI
jgi:hypothetical protein